MKGKVLTFAILSALSAGAMAAGGYSNSTQGPVGPNTRVPDNAAVVATPLLPEQPVTAPSANTGATAAPAPVYAAPAPAYAAPANPPIATTTSNGAVVTNQPVVDANGNIIGSATVVQPSPVWVTQGVAQSGPGATDKTRPGYPDDNTGHSAWDVGTSSAGG